MDIVEAVNGGKRNQMALHTGEGAGWGAVFSREVGWGELMRVRS